MDVTYSNILFEIKKTQGGWTARRISSKPARTTRCTTRCRAVLSLSAQEHLGENSWPRRASSWPRFDGWNGSCAAPFPATSTRCVDAFFRPCGFERHDRTGRFRQAPWRNHSYQIVKKISMRQWRALRAVRAAWMCARTLRPGLHSRCSSRSTAGSCTVS